MGEIMENFPLHFIQWEITVEKLMIFGSGIIIIIYNLDEHHIK